jgi:alginate O-acetyltransferase complex protein AlgI
MLFCTLDYVLFAVGVFLVYWAMPWPKARIWLLLVASFFFYACFNKWLALLIGVSTAVDYFIALGIDAPNATPSRRKWLMILSVTANLGLLCYFKYANFFLESVRATLNTMGIHTSSGVLDIILPVGISFYTFEAINYVVDVYLKKGKAERSLPNFMLFITFFPHLVAGPIVRARDFLPQVRRHKKFSWLRMHVGVQFILLGVFKKIAIADRMAAFVDPIFGTNADLIHLTTDPLAFRTGAVWLGLLAYAIQLYCDFSGYTDIAIGCAHMLGYHLAKNFDMPYRALNIAEYWRRWHISLSTWLRDYLFIPLGGSRGGLWKSSRNLLITFTLAGLWHGAAWHFVCFGVLQGVLLTIHRIFKDYCTARPRLDKWLQTAMGVFLRWGVTFLCILLGYVLFRGVTFPIAANIYYRLFVPAPPGAREAPMQNAGVWLIVAITVVAHYIGARRLWERVHLRLPAPVLGACYVVVLTTALMLSPDGNTPFIYFDF